MKAVHLRLDYLENPLGIDDIHPELSWTLEGGKKQTAYRIVGKLNGQTVLDSGKIPSSVMSHIPFPWALKSRDRVEWSVVPFDENGQEGEPSEPAFFEMGLLEKSDWQTKWIRGNYRVNKKKRYPVDCFRKNITLKKATKARLYATACGLYEIKINGVKAGSAFLTPGITDYRKRIQYQTYDVTSLLKEGDNVLEAELADGWYRGSVGAWSLHNAYGKATKLLLQLEVEEADGTREVIGSDDSFSWSNDGNIRFADNKDGEVVDARLSPSYSGKAHLAYCSLIPSASNNPLITAHERFKPKLIITPKGAKVLDFGQNIAGIIAFQLNAQKGGERIVIKLGEMLTKEGEFTQANFQTTPKKMTCRQEIDYLCKKGLNSYKTRFAIAGFRYAKVETELPFEAKDFTAIALYTDLEDTLSFSSSNPLLDRFVNAVRWSAKGNMADLPTDCPTRERHGWSGDAQIFCKTACYLFSYAPLAKKYEQDLIDFQPRNGKFPQIAPKGGRDWYMAPMDGSVGWADAGVIIPYRLYQMYGDVSFLKKAYPAMAKYAHFMMKRCHKPYLTARPTGMHGKAARYLVNCGQSFGEWAEPADVYPLDWFKEMSIPHPEVSTAYTSYVLGLMETIANILGKKEDAALYHRYSEGAKIAYQALVRTPKFSLDTSRQACLVRPLAFSLLDEEEKAFAEKRLLKALEDYSWRLGTGFLSTPLILPVLSSYDVEAAYRLLENEQMPGWLYMSKMGATTVWESWEGTEAQHGVASLNHYSKGAVLEWVFSTLGGISIAGDRQFALTPIPGGRFTHAELSYQSLYGRVKSSWKKENGKTYFHFEIPTNCEAELTLPKGERSHLDAGIFDFEE